MNRVLRAFALSAMCLGGAMSVDAESPNVRIRIGTIVPEGSPWHETLQYLSQGWRKILGPSLTVQILPNGTAGDEPAMVLKMRTGAIQAVGLSSIGLSHIDSAVSCLQLPMLLASYDELDYVRDGIAAELERRIEAKGFKVVHWADGGWVHLFSVKPARTPADLRAMRLFTSAGDPETEKVYSELGFRVVPMPSTDLVYQLQTGKLDAFALPPLFAQLQQLYRLAPHMTDVRWTPLVGGTVIRLDVWKRLPHEHHEALASVARQAGQRLRPDIRRLGEASIAEMQKRGLTVVTIDAETRKLWEREAENAYPRLRGRSCPAEIFDRVVQLRDEFRARNAKTSKRP